MEEMILDVRGIDATRLLVKPIFNDELNVMNVFKMYQNIKHGKARIHHLNEMEFDLVEDNGCGFEDTGAMNITDRTLHVYPVKGQLTQCYDEFKCTYLDELLGTGLEKADMKGTAVQSLILMQAERALRKTYEKLVWFGDKASANAGLSGVNGLWSVHFPQGIADGKIENVNINSGSALNPGDGIDILTHVWENAPNELKAWAMNEKAFYVTGSVYEQYMKDTEGQGLTCCVDQQYTNLINGQTALTFRGMPVIPFYSWDAYFNGQGQADQHRVLFTVPAQNIVIGTDAQSDLNTIESRFFWKDEKVYTRIKSVFGVDYACESLISLGL
jgi:hypothetical protein